jgi:hypothetical protein
VESRRVKNGGKWLRWNVEKDTTNAVETLGERGRERERGRETRYQEKSRLPLLTSLTLRERSRSLHLTKPQMKMLLYTVYHGTTSDLVGVVCKTEVENVNITKATLSRRLSLNVIG